MIIARRVEEEFVSFRKILIAVGESALAARATDLRFDLAQSLGAELALICVIDPSLDV